MIFAAHTDIVEEVLAFANEESLDDFLSIVNDDGVHYTPIAEDVAAERLGLNSAEEIKYTMMLISDEVFEGAFRLK